MPYNRKILCLANSRKMSGRCLAGKEIAQEHLGGWVRPISDREHQEISEEDRRYKDGRYAKLLDIIAIPMIEPRPRLYQSENHLIDANIYWECVGRATWDQVAGAVDSVNGPLWINGYSTYNGCNDQVPETIASTFQNSLLLINPTRLNIIVAEEGGIFAAAKRRVRADFLLNGERYNLVVTDPWMERRYLSSADGVFAVETSRLCISLGEIFQGFTYKLVAAIITPERAR
jgi:hypothetical protein